MKLYLSAKSKNNVGYTPDWLKVVYEEDGQDLELTLDIRGDIDYDPNTLNCRCKGDLIPWVLYNCDDGDEIILEDMDEDEINEMFPLKRIVEILHTGTYFRLGVFPVNTAPENMKLAEEDVFSDSHGECLIYDGEIEHKISLVFNETELNE